MRSNIKHVLHHPAIAFVSICLFESVCLRDVCTCRFGFAFQQLFYICYTLLGGIAVD